MQEANAKGMDAKDERIKQLEQQLAAVEAARSRAERQSEDYRTQVQNLRVERDNAQALAIQMQRERDDARSSRAAAAGLSFLGGTAAGYFFGRSGEE